VWGTVAPEPYADDELLRRVEDFKGALADG